MSGKSNVAQGQSALFHRDLPTTDVEQQLRVNDGRIIADEVILTENRVSRYSHRLISSQPQRNQAIVKRYSEPQHHAWDTFGLSDPVDVLWVTDDRVTAVETVPPWTTSSVHQATMIAQLPPGTADRITPCDSVWIETRRRG